MSKSLPTWSKTNFRHNETLNQNAKTMSRLQELIDKLCPNGVEYKKLGEVADFSVGFAFKAKDFKTTGAYPVIKITNISNVKVVIGECFIEELPEQIRQDQILKGGEILVGMSGSTGKTGFYEATSDTVVVNQRIGIIRNRKEFVLSGYLKHQLVNKSFETYCFENGTGPQNNISNNRLLNFEIPVPPMEVQEEIVRILDKFTRLTAELQAELQARREQYEYYRNQLLNFKGGVRKA